MLIVTTIATMLVCATTAPMEVPTDKTDMVKFTEMVIVEETTAPKPSVSTTNERKKK